jgi:2-polyprenyl-3-methyl-5-hydroxy-6-metoxy-1,4-benzoquinol methylase
MPTHETFWDNTAHKYAKNPVKDMVSYDQTMHRTRVYLDPDAHALEIGCGTGTTALRLHDAVGHLTATDISSEMIGIAREKARDQGVLNVTFRHADLGDDVGQGPYDVILAFNLLHLVEDLPAALLAIHTMLKPGGVFISKSGCLGEKGWYLRVMVSAMRALGKAPFVANLKIRELDEQVANAGFTIVETRTFPGIALNRFIVARKP